MKKRRPLLSKLADELLSGADRALSRGLTVIEAGGEAAEALLELFYSHAGRAHIVGITGTPGSGKSTLERAIRRELSPHAVSRALLARMAKQ